MEQQTSYNTNYTNPFPGYHEKERVKYLMAMLKELERRKAEKQSFGLARN